MGWTSALYLGMLTHPLNTIGEFSNYVCMYVYRRINLCQQDISICMYVCMYVLCMYVYINTGDISVNILIAFVYIYECMPVVM